MINLLWVVEEGDELRLAPEWEQPPRIINKELPCDIKLIIGDYQSAAGNTYLSEK